MFEDGLDDRLDGLELRSLRDAVPLAVPLDEPCLRELRQVGVIQRDTKLLGLGVIADDLRDWQAVGPN